MFGLQELFDKQIEELFRPNKVGVRLLEKSLKEIGISITDEQRYDLETQFLDLSSCCTLTFNFSDEQQKSAGYSSEAELEPKLKEVIEGLPKKIEFFLDDVDETMSGLVDDVTSSMANSVLQTLEDRMSDMMEDQDAIYHGFANDMGSTWGDALGLLQGLIVISDESSEWYGTRTDKYAENDLVHNLLVRINAKAIQISKEILTLLRNGFSDGALARWRTLHELAVIGAYISEHGDDIAARYINHEAVEVYKAAIQYNEYYTRLGAKEISEEEIEIMRKDYMGLLDLYGQSYKHDYGWAASTLNLNKPTFRDIEASVNLDHYRPYYKAASANVHGNPVGVFNSLGLFPEEDFILSGPSNIGLAQPAQSTIFSLNIITTTMLTHGANVDSLVISKAIAKYCRKVEDAFIAVEEEILQSGARQQTTV